MENPRHPEAGSTGRSARKAQGVRGFVREYTEGLNTRDLRRLFDREASDAYAVLTREHGREPEPKGDLRRLLHRLRLGFLGLSYKLTPARRALFAGSLLAWFLGNLDMGIRYRGDGMAITVEASPFWYTVAVGGLVFLLALELVDRVRVRDELQVARELQADLLPHDVPALPGYLFAHSYRTANEVGGDYYDLTRLSDGRFAILVGDASGHGMAAGLVMAIANATLKTALDLDPDPVRVLSTLNRTLCRTGNRRTFMTVFYGVLDPRTGRLDYVCQGHPFPVLRRADGAVAELAGPGGFPLGLREPLDLQAHTVTLEPGDLLALFTDGLAEAVDPQGQHAFGFDRIAAIVGGGGSPQLVHDRIRDAFERHVAGEPLRDDLTLLVMCRMPPLPAPEAGAEPQ
jgi:phosphoserine phosphatase RsbU/P